LKNLTLSNQSLPLLSLLLLAGCGRNDETHDWPVYLGDNASSQYSSADQITPQNVSQLEVAWTFDAGGVPTGAYSLLECNPLAINGVVYLTSAKLKLYALNGSTGAKQWMFDPIKTLNQSLDTPITASGVNRGLTYWSGKGGDRLVYVVTHYLLAVDPLTGTLIKSFGDEGKVDLKKGLGRNIDNLAYGSRTPGIVYNDLIIMGSSVSESLPAAPGHIRAFNVLTGEQEWRFNTIPQPGEFGYESWPKDAYKDFGGANVWTGMALDDERGLVYYPTGSATFDYYGGDRLGDNLFANSLICLDASTGKRIWHYQTVHHDLWDYDLPTPPNLFTAKQDGKEIPAVALLTKQGYLFVFDRVTGEPLFPIEEIPVPTSTMPGEQTAKTQPRPSKPIPYVRETLSLDQLSDITPESKAEILAKYSSMEPHVPWRPGSLTKDTIVHPGMIGGTEWGGAAMDNNGVLYFNSNESTAILTMIDATVSGSRGETLYNQTCIACHGPDLTGGDAFGQVVPSLIGIKDRKSRAEIAKIIQFGGTTMPGFRHFSGTDIFELMTFIGVPGQTGQHPENSDNSNSETSVRFIHTGNNIWRDSKGYPAIKPPWGNLNAIDLNTGEYLWKTTFGQFDELIEQGIPPTGRESFGGPILTASGLLFIGASFDNYLRAYDRNTGEELWRRKLPFGGYATPSTYTVNGKQFILIACGGGRGSPSADLFVAYALP